MPFKNVLVKKKKEEEKKECQKYQHSSPDRFQIHFALSQMNFNKS